MREEGPSHTDDARMGSQRGDCVEEELRFLMLLPSDNALRALVCANVLDGDVETTRWLAYLLATYSVVSKRKLLHDPRALTILQWLLQDDEPWAGWNAVAMSC